MQHQAQQRGQVLVVDKPGGPGLIPYPLNTIRVMRSRRDLSLLVDPQAAGALGTGPTRGNAGEGPSHSARSQKQRHSQETARDPDSEGTGVASCAHSPLA